MKKLFTLIILSLFLLTGCEFFFGPGGVSASDPYDENCNLKESYHENWEKYSNFDYRIKPETRSLEARTYYEKVEQINEIIGDIYKTERDMAVRDVMIAETRVYRESIRVGNKKNLIKSFIRLSFYTAEVINDNAEVGKGFAKTFLDPNKKGIQLVGEALKLADSYKGINSSLALDTGTVAGKVQDNSKAGIFEIMINWGKEGNGKSVAKDLLEKGASYLSEQIPIPEGDSTRVLPEDVYIPLPTEIKLSDEDFAILKQEHLKLHELDNLIQNAEKENFVDMWLVRVLKQEQIYLENDLFDLKYDEKDRVNAELIADCKRKTGEDESWLSFLSS